MTMGSVLGLLVHRSDGCVKRASSLAVIGLQKCIGYLLVGQRSTQARDAALATLDSLHAQCTNPDMALVQQAGSCSRCRAETGVRGRVCAHCKLDERFMEWEMVLYFIRVKSMQQGKQVTMMEALAQRHVQALKRVGQGGLNEVGMEEALGGAGAFVPSKGLSCDVADDVLWLISI